jgi:hypothetical protein
MKPSVNLVFIFLILFVANIHIKCQEINKYPFNIHTKFILRTSKDVDEAFHDIDHKESVKLMKQLKSFKFNRKLHEKKYQRFQDEKLCTDNQIFKSKFGFTLEKDNPEQDYNSLDYYLIINNLDTISIQLDRIVFNDKKDKVFIQAYERSKKCRALFYNGKFYYYHKDYKDFTFNGDTIFMRLYESIHKATEIDGKTLISHNDTLLINHYILKINNLKENWNFNTDVDTAYEFSFIHYLDLINVSSTPNLYRKRIKEFYCSNNNCIFQLDNQVFINGKSLNSSINSNTIINYTYLKGKAFYLFEKSGKLHVSYNGIDYAQLGFDELYWFNFSFFPIASGTIYFHGRKGKCWYSVKID